MPTTSATCLSCQCPRPCFCWGTVTSDRKFREIAGTVGGLPALTGGYDPNGTVRGGFGWEVAPGGWTVVGDTVFVDNRPPVFRPLPCSGPAVTGTLIAPLHLPRLFFSVGLVYTAFPASCGSPRPGFGESAYPFLTNSFEFTYTLSPHYLPATPATGELDAPATPGFSAVAAAQTVTLTRSYRPGAFVFQPCQPERYDVFVLDGLSVRWHATAASLAASGVPAGRIRLAGVWRRKVVNATRDNVPFGATWATDSVAETSGACWMEVGPVCRSSTSSSSGSVLASSGSALASGFPGTAPRPASARAAAVAPAGPCRHRSDDPHTVQDGTGRLAFTCQKPGFERLGLDVFECVTCSDPGRRCGAGRCPGYEPAGPEDD